ncbi:hypothetical protein TSUD_407720 [Trifolium subterraneum]|uniref:RNase H type-1 domain-containing protein n=1 Tax=Trifolium subterraneum TaxID=3900 RepID=A0A2Z6P4U9_TRISU|nr:hypothetical protein TSUD_407720 [Trifolium subterraneum]
MLNNSSSTSMQLISTITYSIWLARNKKVFQNKYTPADEVVARALNSLTEYQKHLVEYRLHSKQATSSDHNNICWSPPPLNCLKLNVDAHLNDDGRWGFGLILRRTDRRYVGAATRMCAGSHDVAMAEATGLKQALQFIETNHLSNTIVELDAKIIVQAVNCNKFPRSNWGRIASQCARFLSQSSNTISIGWVNRKGNTTAHRLARWALVEPNKNWFFDFPSCIQPYIRKDIGGVS